MNKGPRIIIDVKDVLNNLNEYTVEQYNRAFINQISLDDITTSNIFECLPYAIANCYARMWNEQELWQNLTPPDGAVAGLSELCLYSDCDVYLAAFGPPQHFLWVYNWIVHWFPFVFPDRIILINDIGLLDADIIVSDSIEHLKSRAGWERICFDRPWNRNVHDDIYMIYRVHNWAQIVQLIQEMECDNDGTDFFQSYWSRLEKGEEPLPDDGEQTVHR